MGKKKTKTASGEQLDLIDVRPASAAPIVAAARVYRRHLAVRLAALEKEVAAKAKVLELIKAANLKPVNGKIKFKYDGVTVSVTPRDELVKVKDEND